MHVHSYNVCCGCMFDEELHFKHRPRHCKLVINRSIGFCMSRANAFVMHLRVNHTVGEFWAPPPFGKRPKPSGAKTVWEMVWTCSGPPFQVPTAQHFSLFSLGSSRGILVVFETSVPTVHVWVHGLSCETMVQLICHLSPAEFRKSQWSIVAHFAFIQKKSPTQPNAIPWDPHLLALTVSGLLFVLLVLLFLLLVIEPSLDPPPSSPPPFGSWPIVLGLSFSFVCEKTHPCRF